MQLNGQGFYSMHVLVFVLLADNMLGIVCGTGGAQSGSNTRETTPQARVSPPRDCVNCSIVCCGLWCA